MPDRDYVDGVVEATNSTGAGPLTLEGAKEGYFPFPEGYDGDVHILMDGYSEISRCTVSGSTLTRVVCLRSSNADAFVNFPAGEKTVAAVFTAEAVQEIIASIATANSWVGRMLTISTDVPVDGIGAEGDIWFVVEP